MNTLHVTLFSLLHLLFSQVFFVMPVHQAGHASIATTKIATNTNIATTAPVVQASQLHAHHQESRSNAKDLNSTPPHDCNHGQQQCDHCTSMCSQLRIAFALGNFLLHVPAQQTSTQKSLTPDGHTHAGYFSALYKPPIFS